MPAGILAASPFLPGKGPKDQLKSLKRLTLSSHSSGKVQVGVSRPGSITLSKAASPFSPTGS